MEDGPVDGEGRELGIAAAVERQLREHLTEGRSELESMAGGVLNTGGNAVGGFGALIVPIVAAHFGWVAALSTGSVLAFVAAALWLFIRADEPMKTTHQEIA